MLTTDQKRSIAELAIGAAAAKLHIGVYKPLTDGERCDLIFNLHPQLLRVQCKWATRRGEVLVVRCYSCRRAREGMRHRTYTVEEVDVIAGYCLELGSTVVSSCRRRCSRRAGSFICVSGRAATISEWSSTGPTTSRSRLYTGCRKGP